MSKRLYQIRATSSATSHGLQHHGGKSWMNTSTATWPASCLKTATGGSGDQQPGKNATIRLDNHNTILFANNEALFSY